MTPTDLIPFDPESQRRLERHWHSAVAGRAGAGGERLPVERSFGVRGIVQASWRRSFQAEVSPDLPTAPVVLDEGQLSDTADRTDWLAPATTAIAFNQRSWSGIGHILSLFDHEARMLTTDGDAAALEGLAAINFRPGGLWSESAVGTNGPGTALATAQPAHIVGAEHFCASWHRWHCAAVPIRDPATGQVLGVLDISGFREFAHPHTLNLALALVVAIEQTLAARDIERRYLTLSRYAELSTRYPGDAVLAVDRAGRVLSASPAAPALLRAIVPDLVERSTDARPREVSVPLASGEQHPGIWYPVLQGRTVVGGCLVLEDGCRVAGSEGVPFGPGDVEGLARRFFAASARALGRPEVQIDAEVYRAFSAYRWPGDVRELKQVIRRLLLVAGRQVTLADLPQAIRAAHSGSGIGAGSAIDREDALLVEVVQDSRTMEEAALKLGITRSTLYRRMERFGLKPRRILGRE